MQLGVELHTAFLDAAKKEGLEIVFSKSYPFGTSDLQPLIREVMASNPDAFIAFSYPPDTFMLTEQSRIVGFNPQILYAAIGSAFPDYKSEVRQQRQRHPDLRRNGPDSAGFRMTTTRRIRRCSVGRHPPGRSASMVALK